MLITLAIFHSLCEKAYNWYSSASACTDSEFQGYLRSYQQFFGDAMAVIMASVFVVTSWVVADVVFLLWRLCKGDLEE